MDQIWWRKITKANHFINTVANLLLENKNLILAFPQSIPWRDTMYEMIEGILHEENPEYRLVFNDCPGHDVGQFLLEEYCKKEKRASYRYGMSYAAFLAQSNGIVLNSRYVWIKNVTVQKLDEWCKFIMDYNQNLPKHTTSAVFILEISDTRIRAKAMKGLYYLSFDDSIDFYDKFTFCALASTDIDIKPHLRPYLAELVSTVCKSDIELCSLCIRHWQDFLSEPYLTLKEIINTEHHSDGTSFDIDMNPGSIDTLIWEGQIKLLFPVIERYRSVFVKRHAPAIESCLPIQNSNGEIIDNPQDVELGSLIQLAGQKRIFLSTAEYKQLDQFRCARNDLAHLSVIEFARADSILSQNLP